MSFGAISPHTYAFADDGGEWMELKQEGHSKIANKDNNYDSLMSKKSPAPQTTRFPYDINTH